jgi:hypothetical protein
VVAGEGFATPPELDRIEAEEEQVVLEARARAWDAYRAPINAERDVAVSLMDQAGTAPATVQALRDMEAPLRRDILASVAEVLLAARDKPLDVTEPLRRWKHEQEKINTRRYGSHLHSESEQSCAESPRRSCALLREANDPERI